MVNGGGYILSGGGFILVSGGYILYGCVWWRVVVGDGGYF